MQKPLHPPLPLRLATYVFLGGLMATILLAAPVVWLTIQIADRRVVTG